MTFWRSNTDLTLLAFALGAGSLTYAIGAFVLGLTLHPPNQHGWSGFEMIAVGPERVNAVETPGFGI